MTLELELEHTGNTTKSRTQLKAESEINRDPRPSRWRTRLNWCGGVGFTWVIAWMGVWLARVPGFNHVGPLACAILIAIGYRQVAGYPKMIRNGIQFSSKRLLRFAIILFGLKLNIDVILHDGLWLLVRDAGTIAFAIGMTVMLARIFKADASLSLLLGVGTGVCGAAAIAAVSPILKAKEEDTAIGVGIIALIGTVFALLYTLLRTILPLTAHEYGVWCGVSLHEIAHVALAAAPAGSDALGIALLAKLGRVFLLVPLSLLFVFWMRRKQVSAYGGARIEFPWFLIGFVAMSLVGSYVLGHWILVPTAGMNQISNLTTFILTMAMVGLGLNVSFQDLRTKALRPLLAMILTSVLLSLITFVSL